MKEHKNRLMKPRILNIRLAIDTSELTTEEGMASGQDADPQ